MIVCAGYRLLLALNSPTSEAANPLRKRHQYATNKGMDSYR